jgi:hypothetical protein
MIYLNNIIHVSAGCAAVHAFEHSTLAIHLNLHKITVDNENDDFIFVVDVAAS